MKYYVMTSPKNMAQEASASQPSLNSFGLMWQDEGTQAVGIYALGGRYTQQEDRISVGLVPPEMAELTSEQKISVLSNTIQKIGDGALRLSMVVIPTTEDEDEEDEEDLLEIQCVVKSSGSTLSVALIDNMGVTVAHVGDSPVVACIVKPHGEVHMQYLTEDHDLNATALKTGTLKYRAFGTRATVGGLGMARAMGDIIAHQHGVTHTPTVNYYDYQKIENYHPDEDQLYITTFSDGLMQFDLFEEEYEAIRKSKTDDFMAKMEKYEMLDKKKKDAILNTFKACIQKNIAEKSTQGIPTLIATSLMEAVAQANGGDLGKVQDNMSVVVAPAGNFVKNPLYISEKDSHGKTKNQENLLTSEFIECKFDSTLSAMLNQKLVEKQTAHNSTTKNDVTSMMRRHHLMNIRAENESPNTTPAAGTPLSASNDNSRGGTPLGNHNAASSASSTLVINKITHSTL